MNEETREAVRGWLQKATIDWTTIEVLLESKRCPRESVCFHCQQYVEKLLKAMLTLHGIEAPKTHDLKRLVQLAASKCPELLRFEDRVDSLTAHAIQSRYPGDWLPVEEKDMRNLVDLTKELADLLLPLLRV